MERRLTAIMTTDVVGYSRLIGEDETGTLAALKAHRDELIEPKIAEHNGRVVKLMGDGLLAEFASAVEAVLCAVQIQHLMVERITSTPNEQHLTYRIGVNIGDIVVEGDDIYGDGVNVAARLEEIAKPGGICISGKVHEEVRDKLDLKFEDLGEVEVKNISRPVPAFQVHIDDNAAALATPIVKAAKPGTRNRASLYAAALASCIAIVALAWWQPWLPEFAPARAEKMVHPLPGKPSIAVLAFESLGKDSEQERLGESLAENIITDLSRFSELFVIARNSSFSYKGKPVNIRKVSEELGVRYVLEGSLQKANNKLRINVQLIDALAGNHVWAERYDRNADSVFKLQDEISRTVVASVATSIEIKERKRLSRKSSTNYAAHEYWVSGKEIWEDDFRSKEANEKALKLFKKAVELDPNYNRGYLGIAHVYYSAFRFNFNDLSFEENRDLALKAARKAVQLAPKDHITHEVLGIIHLKLKDFEKAFAEFDEARRLNPNAEKTLMYIAEALNTLGRNEEALLAVKQAIRLNPHHPEWYYWTLGGIQYDMDRPEEALETMNKISNVSHGMRRIFMLIYVRLDRLKEARAELAKYLNKEPDWTIRKFTKYMQKLGYPPHVFEKDAVRLRKIGVPE